MRLALISDIHGNLVAFEAALADLRQYSPDMVICLGDVAANGPQPRQVLARLRILGWPVVMGNTDEWLLQPKPWTAVDEDSAFLLDMELWAAEQLDSEDLAFIRSFQPTISVPLGGDQQLLCYHGSPRFNRDLILPTTTDAELASMFAEQQAALMAGGHTHQAMLRRYGDGLLINPGSVGLPFIQLKKRAINPLWAEYALISAVNGALDVMFRRVSIDKQALATAVYDSGMPHAAWWLHDWIDVA